MGQGFYLSPDESFCRLWAQEGWQINRYELFLDGLKTIELGIDDKWYEELCSNRNYAKDKIPEYDVVIAPIANDTIFDLLGILSSGYVPKKVCLKVFGIEPKYTQIVLKNEKSIANLRYLDSSTINKDEAESNKKTIKAMEEKFLIDAKKALGKYGRIIFG